MPSDPTNLDQLDEQLVAYLDGELEPQAAKQIENLLATDEYARSRLNQLASSWDLLDQLPQATVDDLFTRTTVEMVALAAEDEVIKAQAADPIRRRRRWLEGSIATLAAAAVGFVVVAFAMPNQNDTLLRDLPIIKNLDVYREAGNIELLKQFQKAKMFAGDAYASSAGKPSDVHAVGLTADSESPIPTLLSERRAWVEALSPSDKLELRDELEKFSALPAKQQQILRDVDQQLSSDSDGRQLRQIMQHYYDWLKTLTSADRASALNETNPQDQIKAIRQLRQGQMGQAFSWLEPGLNLLKDPDSAGVLQWMRDFADNHEAELTAALAEKKGPASQAPDDRRRRRPLAAWLAWQQWWSPSATGTPPVTTTDIHALHALLSSEKQKELDAEPTLFDQVQLVRRWVQTACAEFRELAVQSFGRWGGPNPERLKRFEEQQLSSDEKKELEGLTSVERMRKLMELFQKHRIADFQRASSGAASRQSSDAAANNSNKNQNSDQSTAPAKND